MWSTSGNVFGRVPDIDSLYEVRYTDYSSYYNRHEESPKEESYTRYKEPPRYRDWSKPHKEESKPDPSNGWVHDDLKKKYARILEVDVNASVREIRKQYKELSRRWHPDKNPDSNDAGDKFKEINNAYEGIMNIINSEQGRTDFYK